MDRPTLLKPYNPDTNFLAALGRADKITLSTTAVCANLGTAITTSRAMAASCVGVLSPGAA